MVIAKNISIVMIIILAFSVVESDAPLWFNITLGLSLAVYWISKTVLEETNEEN